MHVFLAGATGVIGRRLLPLLLADGHQVTALTRGEAGAAAVLAAGGTPVIGDVYDADGLAALVRAVSPDLVMHQLTDLGHGNLADNARIRIVGTRNLVDAALAAGVRRMIAQSIAWVYEGGTTPADEATAFDRTAAEPRKSTIDGVAALESAVREMPEWVILRYGLLYGPQTWYARDGLMGDRARAGALVPNDDVSSFVHVDDAARAALLALSWPSGTTTHITDDEPAPARTWLPVFCKAVGAPQPAEQPPGVQTPWARGADNHHARRHLGWQPEHESWRVGFLA